MPELDDILEHIRRIRREALETVAALRQSRQQVEEQSAKLESPKMIFDYIDTFVPMFEQSAAELERIAAALPEGIKEEHLDTLRQLASNSAAEQRRCVGFRDKCINRPLPFEQVRPLLNQISVDSRDQLNGFRSLNDAVERLRQLVAPAVKPPESDKLDRRALFTKWFGQ
jgi:hypothetical protein